MAKDKQQAVEFLANIREVKSRNLRSGDKQVTIELVVVGKDVIEALRLAQLAPVEQIKVTYGN